MRLAFVALFASCQPIVEEAPPQEVASRRQIAAGSFRGLGIEGSRDASGEIVEDGTIVTLADADDTGGTLSMLPFDGGDGCAAGHAVGFDTHGVGWFQGVLLSIDPMRVGAWGPPGEFGGQPFRFVDGACADAAVVPDPIVRPPFRDFSTPYDDLDERVTTPYVVWTLAGDVLRVDPWTHETVTLASGVSAFETGWWDPDEDVFPELLLFLVENGALVVRDTSGAELARAGSGVTEVSPACPVVQEGDTNYLEGFCETPDAAYVDDTGLHLLSRDAVLAADACQPRLLGGIRSLDSETPAALLPTLAYLSPCADRRLVVRNLQDDSETVHADAVFDVRRLWSGAIVYVLDDGPVPGVGTGFLISAPSAESIEIAPNVELATVEPYAIGLLVLANGDGTVGDLGVWTEETGFLPAKSGVVEFTSNLLLAVLKDFDGETGTLDVVDVVTGASQIEPGEDPLEPTAILTAERVPRDGFRWSESTRALDWLEAFDAARGTGTLRTWIVPDSLAGEGPGEPLTGERGFLVDEGVSQWLELQWPDAGALYVVEDGERDGIWFADWRE